MLSLATPWTFDPGQLSALRPGANVMVLETVAVFTELIVSVQLVRFLWGLQRHTAVAKGMVWMCAALIVITACRILRWSAVWRTSVANSAVVSLPGIVVLVTLLFPEAEEALDLHRAVDAALPLGGRAPGELGGLGRALQHFARVEQRLHVNAVGDGSHDD